MHKPVRWLIRLYVWATHRLYNEFAWAYDPVSWLVSVGHWAGWRRMALDHVIGQRVLEVGFGTGELLIEMAQRGLRVCGLERSPAMHRITARKMGRRGVWTPRVRAVTQRAPFVEESFDSIIATFPAAYIIDPATLREIARLLRRPDPRQAACGGRFIVVGLAFDPDNRFLRRAKCFALGVSIESFLARYRQIAAAAGLRVSVVAGRGRGLRMPAIIAERCT